MIKDLKICGVSDPKTLNYILNHPNPPKFIGFITNYKKSKRYVTLENLKNLVKVNKKQTNFVSVLVKPTNELLEKIKDLNFDYYQLYDVSPKKTQEIKSKYKVKIITALTIENSKDVQKFKKYKDISEIILFDSKGYEKSLRFNTKADDQKRVLTPKQAYKNGSDWLVIGRPITKGNIKKNIQSLVDHLSK